MISSFLYDEKEQKNRIGLVLPTLSGTYIALKQTMIISAGNQHLAHDAYIILT